MKIFKITFWLLIMLVTGGIMEAQTLKVKTFDKSFPLTDEAGNQLEPSAIEPINDKYFLVADDKGADLYIVETAKEKVVHTLKIPGFSVEKPKWEAMAFDGEFFYLLGSHAVKLDDKPEKLTKKLAARSHLLRFKLENTDGDAKNIKINSFLEINASESLKTLGLYNSDPFKNKVKIEGLAFRKSAEKKELIFALREPHEIMQVLFADLPNNPAANEKLTLKPFFSFDAGRIGTIPFRLSSIEYVPEWQGFFMLTSTEDAETNAFFGNALWFVSDQTLKNSTPSKPVVPQIIHLFSVDMKAEGLCVLPDVTNEKLRLALVFDNDFDDTKIAGMMQLIEISRK